jgi:hypothetical protein
LFNWRACSPRLPHDIRFSGAPRQPPLSLNNRIASGSTAIRGDLKKSLSRTIVTAL